RIRWIREMRRVADPSMLLLGFDLTSEIDTHTIELSDHCLDLVRSPAALIDIKFYAAAQTLTLVRIHGRFLNCLASGHWPARLLATQNSGQHVKMLHTRSLESRVRLVG